MENQPNSQGRKVAIIGAGISGLVTAKVMRKDGFSVTVFEKESEIGGVWASKRTYPGLRANNSRVTYAYSDYPYKKTVDIFPAAEDVRNYLLEYADHFGILDSVLLSTRVVEVTRSEHKFNVRFSNFTGTHEEMFDFVVVCAGTYSEPNIPNVSNFQDFTGKILHTSQVSEAVSFAGNRVVVVGAGKSALDCAAWVASKAKRCALVFRSPHWMAPRYLAGVLRSDLFLLGPLPELFARYYRLSKAQRLLHHRMMILVDTYWRFTEFMIRTTLRIPSAMVPPEHMPLGLTNIGLVSDFYRIARRGDIDLFHDTIALLGPGKRIELATGTEFDADIVIYGTGWIQKLDFLSPDLASAVLHDGRFKLYRHILPPTVRRIGFIGYAASTASQLTSEVSAHWLSRVFQDKLELPEEEGMIREIGKVMSWLSDVFPTKEQGYFIGPHLIHHINDLIEDMGACPPRRRWWISLFEFFRPWSPDRYAYIGNSHAWNSSNGRGAK